VKRHQVVGVLSACVLWDLPGVGTPTFPQATYLKDMGIRHYDVIVLMTASRFTEAELKLVEELKRWRVPFFLVRNKVDADVQAEVEKAEDDCEEEEMLSEERRAEVEANTIRDIKTWFSGLDLPKVYCITTRPRLREQFDFQALEADIEEAVKSQRAVNLERECPVCFEIYTDSGGPAGHKKETKSCKHTACEACWRSLDRCYACDAPV